MLNEMLLTTTLCVAIVGVMALFYGELELLQNKHYFGEYEVTSKQKPRLRRGSH